MQGFNAGSWWAMSGINLCIGINWTCLSRCVDREPGESAFSIHKLSGLFQGQVIQARPSWQCWRRQQYNKKGKAKANACIHTRRQTGVNSRVRISPFFIPNLLNSMYCIYEFCFWHTGWHYNDIFHLWNSIDGYMAKCSWILLDLHNNLNLFKLHLKLIYAETNNWL